MSFADSFLTHKAGYFVNMVDRMDGEALLSAEHSGWKALCTPNGADFYDEIMLDGGVMLLVGGMRMSKAEAVAAIRQSPPWDNYEITDAEFIPLSDVCGALVYSSTSNRDDMSFTALMSSTYVLRDGELRLALYQQTPIGQ